MITWSFGFLYRKYAIWENTMEIPRLYLLVLGKYYDLGPESEPKI